MTEVSAWWRVGRWVLVLCVLLTSSASATEGLVLSDKSQFSAPIYTRSVDLAEPMVNITLVVYSPSDPEVVCSSSLFNPPNASAGNDSASKCLVVTGVYNDELCRANDIARLASSAGFACLLYSTPWQRPGFDALTGWITPFAAANIPYFEIQDAVARHIIDHNITIAESLYPSENPFGKGTATFNVCIVLSVIHGLGSLVLLQKSIDKARFNISFSWDEKSFLKCCKINIAGLCSILFIISACLRIAFCVDPCGVFGVYNFTATLFFDVFISLIEMYCSFLLGSALVVALQSSVSLSTGIWTKRITAFVFVIFLSFTSGFSVSVVVMVGTLRSIISPGTAYVALVLVQSLGFVGCGLFYLKARSMVLKKFREISHVKVSDEHNSRIESTSRYLAYSSVGLLLSVGFSLSSLIFVSQLQTGVPSILQEVAAMITLASEIPQVMSLAPQTKTPSSKASSNISKAKGHIEL